MENFTSKRYTLFERALADFRIGALFTAYYPTENKFETERFWEISNIQGRNVELIMFERGCNPIQYLKQNWIKEYMYFTIQAKTLRPITKPLF